MVKAERQKLPKSSILRGRNAFDAVFSNKAKILHQSGLSFRFLYRELTEAAPNSACVGFISPKRLGSAPLRNRARRRVREAYRINRATFIADLSNMQVIPQLQGVFIIKNADLAFEQVLHQTQSLLDQCIEYLTKTQPGL